MNKFMFSLDKVLNFKQQTLDVKKNELAHLRFQLRELEQKIDDLNHDFAVANQKMILELQDGLTPRDISIYKIYFNDINQKTKKLISEKLQLMEVIEQKKRGVVELNSEISGLERLRDKQLEAYFKAVRKAEELAIEEFVSQGH